MMNLSWLDVILAILAVFRTTQFVVYEDGLFDFMLKIRIRAGVYRKGEDGRSETQAGKLLECPHCVGAWISLLAAALLFPVSLETIVLFLAIAGGQSLLERNV